MIVLVQSSFHTNWASLFEMELEPNSLDWNGNELEHELELKDMKLTLELMKLTVICLIIILYHMKVPGVFQKQCTLISIVQAVHLRLWSS